MSDRERNIIPRIVDQTMKQRGVPEAHREALSRVALAAYAKAGHDWDASRGTPFLPYAQIQVRKAVVQETRRLMPGTGSAVPSPPLPPGVARGQRSSPGITGVPQQRSR